MSTHQIHVFISHSWTYSDHYDTLSEWVFNQSWRVGQASLAFRDFSVPKSDPIHNAPNSEALKAAIFARISRSHVVIIPSGMYANHSNWIQKEISGAKQYGKPILGVEPWGQQRSSQLVAENADKMVGWNREPMINAIWDLYYRLGSKAA